MTVMRGLSGFCAAMVMAGALALPAMAQSPSSNMALFVSSEDIPRGPVEPRVAILRGLEKITARVREIEVPVGQPVRVGRLEVLVRYCESRPPEEEPETTAYIDIDDHKLDGSVERVFSGWMFASAPALNALEHPVYDVWVMNCKALEPEQAASSR